MAYVQSDPTCNVLVAHTDGSGELARYGPANWCSLSADGRTVAWQGWGPISVAAVGGPAHTMPAPGLSCEFSMSADASTVAWCQEGEIYAARADGLGTPVNVSRDPGASDMAASLQGPGRANE